MINQSLMFQDRSDAALRLAEKLKGRRFVKPVVLGIPRGGLVTGAVLAKELGAELDVVLARKLRAPFQPEYAIGSISEDGLIYLTNFAKDTPGVTDEYLAQERDSQLHEIARRKQLFRVVHKAVPLKDRSVIVTDDGIATGATMIAGLQSARAENPKELIVAIPVAAEDRLDEVRKWCDEVICVYSDANLSSVGQFYDDFRQVEDEEVLELLRQFDSPGMSNKPTG